MVRMVVRQQYVIDVVRQVGKGEPLDITFLAR